MTKQCQDCLADIPVRARSCPQCGADVGGALAHLRVLDLTGPYTQYCGRLMADMGADVVKVEPPEGDPGRYLKPFAGEVVDPERSITFLAFNLNKRSVLLDLKDERDLERFRSLAAAADILLDDGAAGDLKSLSLGYEEMRGLNPGLIYTSITPFGLWGPYSAYLGGELIVQALGGLMYGYGDPDVRPAMAPLGQGHQLAAQHAAFATLAALRYRNISGRGQHVEVSIQEVLANILAYFSRYADAFQINRRLGAGTNMAPTNTYPTKDGLIYMQPSYPRHIEALFEWIGDPALDADAWKDREFRRQNSDVLTPIISEFTMGFTKMEFVQEAQRRHIPCAVLMTTKDLVQDEHLRSRDFFVSLDHPVVGRYEAPSCPFRMTESPWRFYSSAPRLGQDPAAVMEEWAEPRRSEASISTPRSTTGATRSEPPLPLEGLRILDFSRVWAGPYMTRYLAELGAEVIKVESNMLPDRGQAVGPFGFNFAEINRGKRSITLNMTRKKARLLAERLVQSSDVIVENFRSGVLDQWGLGYQRLRELKPSIIYLSMPGMGNSGPRASELTYGQSLLAYTGLMDLWAHPESPGITRPKVPLPDFIAAATGAFALLSALEYRDRTGKGQMIELAQLEGLVGTMGVALLDISLNGRIWEACGNRDSNFAPHDVFPCLGHDAWCAIACYTEEQWRALCAALDNPPWTHDPRFAHLDGRLKNLEELNAHIGSWTCEMTSLQVMRTLQKAGVPAGIVANAEDLYYDINLRARDYIVTVDHRPVFDILEQPGGTVHLSETPSRIVASCPQIGQHNQAVFGGLLGLSDQEIQRLAEEQVIY